jgi:branched-subunit amino acid transport protein AzlD
MAAGSLSCFQAVIAAFVSAAVIFATRAFPFALFSRREPPVILRFIEKNIPPLVMAILLVYCLKSVRFTQSPFGVPELAALAVTAAAHLWKGNPMLSIFGGTAVFMLLCRLWGV